MAEENKKRIGARVSVSTLEQLEEYQHENGIGNRSAAIEHLVENREQMARAKIWEWIQQQAMYAVMFALLVSLISLISFAVAFVQSGYPSRWASISFAFLGGCILFAAGSCAVGVLAWRWCNNGTD